MPTLDPRIDAYIDKSAEFAKPILIHLRSLIHEVCPDVVETMRWSFPHFDYQGTLCHMAAFKQHCGFGFWKGSLIVEKAADGNAMSQFGHVTKMSDLPSKKQLKVYILKAMKLNEDGVKVPKPKKAAGKKSKLAVPPDLKKALGKHKTATATFANLSSSCQREYIEWITQAKREETRQQRLETAVQWIAEGKKRNWKYEKC